MLLKNKFFSSLYFYLTQLENSVKLGQFIRTTASTYDKESSDKITYRLDNFLTTLNFSSDIILKEVTYRGYLEYVYDKKTNEVLLTHVPYVQYADLKIPLFTNDLVRLLVNSLAKYTQVEELKLRCQDDSTLLAIDEKAVKILPSLKETKNYSLLQRLMFAIDKEKRKIEAEVLRYQQKSKREELARERALEKKRKIYGLDPNAFENNQQFLEAFSRRLIDIYTKKIDNIKRHIEASKKAYLSLLKKTTTDDEERIVKDLSTAFENIFKKARVFLGAKPGELSFHDYLKYLNPSLDSFDYTLEGILDFISYNCDDIELNDDDIWNNLFDYICESTEMEEVVNASSKMFSYAEDNDKDIQDILKKYYGYVKETVIEDYDENSEILKLLKAAQVEADARRGYGNRQFEDELTEEEKELWWAGNGYPLMILMLIKYKVRDSVE